MVIIFSEDVINSKKLTKKEKDHYFKYHHLVADCKICAKVGEIIGYDQINPTKALNRLTKIIISP
jgi:hypothetical protein